MKDQVVVDGGWLRTEFKDYGRGGCASCDDGGGAAWRVECIPLSLGKRGVPKVELWERAEIKKY